MLLSTLKKIVKMKKHQVGVCVWCVCELLSLFKSSVGGGILTDTAEVEEICYKGKKFSLLHCRKAKAPCLLLIQQPYPRII